MRQLSPDEFNVLDSAEYKIHARLTMRGIPFADLVGADPLLEAGVVADADAPVQDASFTCDLLKGSNSLSPYWSAGAKLDGVPLLISGAYLDWQIQCVAPGGSVSPTAWRSVFHGLVDDIDVQRSTSQVKITCRDAMVRLLKEIQNQTTIAPISGDPGGIKFGFPVDAGLTTAQLLAILNAAWNYAYGVDYPENFNVLSEPGSSESAFWQEPMKILEALRAIGVGRNGYDLRGRWDITGPDTFALTYYLPDRAGLAPASVFARSRSPGQYPFHEMPSLKWSRVGVKNIARIVPADDLRVPVITTNAESLAFFGDEFLSVSEDATSHIEEPGEAADLGGIITSDLGFPKAGLQLLTPFLWQFELGDLFILAPVPDVWDNLSRIYGITRLELSYKGGTGSTVITGRENAGISQASFWRTATIQKRPKMEYIRITDPVGPSADGATWSKVDDVTVAVPV